MKRKWQIFIALFLVLVTAVTVAVPALAQDDATAATENALRGALAIIAPWTVPAGREFTARVFLREDQEPFPGAGVWLIGADGAATLKDALSELRQDQNQAAATADYESIIGAYGTFLGRTGDDGRVTCTIDQAGRYILVAARNGYLPGFTCIGIRVTVKALGIRAPQFARVGQPVTIGVFDRAARSPVEGAGVWAVGRDNAAALQQDVANLRADTTTSADQKDYESVVSLYGTLLGRTGPDGKLTATFDTAGGYLLVAIKGGYIPGFAMLVVRDVPQPTVTPQSRMAPGLSGADAVPIR
jgi:hypothetical protein